MMIGSIGIAVLVIIITVLFILELRRIWLNKDYQHLPGDKQYPVIGSIYTLKPNKIQDFEIMFSNICCAPIARFYFGGRLIFAISDADAFQQVLSGNMFSERPFLFDFFRLKKGIIMTKYHFWRPLRKALSPAFTNKASLSFIPIFAKNFTKLANDLEKFVDTNQVIDVGKSVIDTGVQIILETNFDYDQSDDRITASKLEILEDNISERMFNVRYHPNLLYRWSKLYKPDKRLFTEMSDAFKDIYQRRTSKLEKGEAPRHIFIDELFRFVKSYESNQCEEILFDNAVTIFAAGYETAALTVSYAILMLAMHPEIDSKVDEELKKHYNPDNGIDSELLKKLQHLDIVVKETLRLFPAAPLSVRETLEDTFVDKIGTIRKGTIILFNFYNLHRNEEWWGPDANKFNPENFSLEATEGRHPFAYLPYSGGPRMCLGYQYATYNIKVGLIILLTRYRFETDLKLEDLRYKFSVTLKLLNKHLVRIYKRNH